MQIKYYKIGDINLASYNPRNINESEFSGLKESLKKFGFVDPLIYNLRTKTLVGGHARIKAAKALGMDKVPVVEVDLSLIEEKALNVTLNNQKISGHFTHSLGEILDEIRVELGDDFFRDIKLDEIEVPPLPEEEQAEEDARADNIPEVAQNELGVAVGDIYQLGEHRLMCGDSTDLATVEKLMNGEKADMVFTDPPYGVSYTGGNNKKTNKKLDQIMNDSLSGADLSSLFHDSLTNAALVANDSAAFYIWYSTNKSVETFSAFLKLPLKVRAVLCWYKVNSRIGAFMSQYIPNYEPCIYAFKEGCSPQWYGPSDEKAVWQMKKEGENEFHPTQKPVELSERAINNSSKATQIILDLFLGSGSTLIACEKTNRKCYGMELDPHYCSVIIKRWEIFTNKKAVKL